MLLMSCILCLVVPGCTPEDTDPQGCIPVVRPPIAISPYSDPVWNPDGSTIGFNHAPLTRIVFDPSDCIYYNEFEDSLAGFYMAAQTGTDMRRVLDFGLGDPDWSLNGEWIAFSSFNEIWTIQVAGGTPVAGTQRRLTDFGWAGNPSWSPKADRIAFSVGIGPEAGIYIMRADGTDQRRIGEPGWSGPDWSPDGTRLTYGGWGRTDSTPGVWTMNSEGEGTTLVKATGLLYGHPQWSPGGNQIAYVAKEDSKDHLRLWIVNADGSGLRQVVPEAVGARFYWSPDGHEIVFARYAPLEYTYENGTLWIVDLETGIQRQLTTNPQREVLGTLTISYK